MNKLKTHLSLFFSKREQKKIIFVFFLMLLASFLELLSLGMILPITSVFLNDTIPAHLNFFDMFSSKKILTSLLISMFFSLAVLIML